MTEQELLSNSEFEFFKIKKDCLKIWGKSLYEFHSEIYKIDPELHFKLDNIFNYLIPLSQEYEILKKETYNDFYLKTVNRFKNIRGYDFCYNNSKTKKVEFSLEEMIRDCLEKVLAEEFSKKNKKKEFCLKTCYKTLLSYIREVEKYIKIKYSHYQLSAISAYIALLFGYDLGSGISKSFKEGTPISNQELFHAVDNHTKKYKSS